MRQFSLALFLVLAGCGVTSRSSTELEYLQEIDRLLQANDSCGLWQYVVSRPFALAGDDELSKELRSFVWQSRDQCASRERSALDDTRSDQMDRASINTRNSVSGTNNNRLEALVASTAATANRDRRNDRDQETERGEVERETGARGAKGKGESKGAKGNGGKGRGERGNSGKGKGKGKKEKDDDDDDD
ncbi:hypothetical protein [Ruegeria arenilitoris]|uniref:hypothetical protein n=1 Tax=Ruegeria arenilitoris TaxID=1173585 RepID=UPI00147ECF84|nr:hypothetical protein [Ruegeria arenilitoris]